MEPSTLGQRESTELDELFNGSMSFDFSRDGADDEWTKALLNEALEVDVSIPFPAIDDLGGRQAVTAFDSKAGAVFSGKVPETLSNQSDRSDEYTAGNDLDTDFDFSIEEILFPLADNDSGNDLVENRSHLLGSLPGSPRGSLPDSSPGSSSDSRFSHSTVVDVGADGDQSPWFSFCDSFVTLAEPIPSFTGPASGTASATRDPYTPQGSADSSSNLEGNHSGTEDGVEARAWMQRDQESTSGSEADVSIGNAQETDLSNDPGTETCRGLERDLPEGNRHSADEHHKNIKRKKKAENTNGKGNLHGVNFSDATNSSSASGGGGGGDEDEKRKARLMRNRESAQLSRQRKKNYVDDLEEKVKNMNSTIVELNNTIAYISAENIKLRQQLGALSQPPNPGSQTPVAPAAPMPYPWVPFPAYPGSVAGAPMGGRVFAPGSHVPLVPIPRLKSQQTAAVSKVRKSPKVMSSEQERSKPAKRIKKVASVAFLGFFFIFFLLGRIVPGVNLTFRESKEILNGSIDLSSGIFPSRPGGRVLTSWDEGNSTVDKFRAMNMQMGTSGVGQGDAVSGKRENTDFDEGKGRLADCKDDERLDKHAYLQNISERLVASLFIPRNDKPVKIDGNLIIHSVLAGERALRMSGSVSQRDKEGKTHDVAMEQDSEKNSLAIVTERHGALAAATDSGRSGNIQSHLFGTTAENKKALASNSRNSYREDAKSTTTDGSPQQWFREGLTGPVLSSGTCTEVFQFDASPDSPNSKLVTSILSRYSKGSDAQSRESSSGSKINEPQSAGRPVNMPKNRRVSYAVPLPPARTALKDRNERNFTEHAERIHEKGEYPGKNTSSSMVVSVLVDPRETGDEGRLSSGSLSRIFVVVLIDSVKYVTYSCVVPSKGSVPHLVTS